MKQVSRNAGGRRSGGVGAHRQLFTLPATYIKLQACSLAPWPAVGWDWMIWMDG